MNKKIILLIGMFVLLSSFVMGATIRQYYSFDDADLIGGTVITDLASGYNATKKGSGEPLQKGGILGQAIKCDGIDDYATLPSLQWQNELMSHSFWINTTDTTVRSYVLAGTDTSQARMRIELESDGDATAHPNSVYYYSKDESTNDRLDFFKNNAGVNDGSWHHVVVMANPSGAGKGEIWIDGVNISVSYERQDVGNGNAQDIITEFCGNYIQGTGPGDVIGIKMIDEYSVYTGWLNATEIATLYNGGVGYNPYASVPVTSSVLLNSPNTGESFNINNISFNFNYTESNGNFANCSLFLNNVSEYTTKAVLNGSTNYEINKTGLIDGTYYWYINCISNETDTNSSTRLMYIDITNPILSTTFVNNSLAYETISGVFNLTDETLLYSYNVSIDGTQIDGATNLGLTEFIYNLSYDVTSLSGGEHNLTVRVADGHTAKELKGDYKTKNGWFNQYQMFEFEEPYNNGWIKIQEANDKSWFDEWKADKKIDRYSFTYKPSKMKKTQAFEITSSFKLNIIDNPNTKYKRWIVFDEHWLDFMPYTDVSYEIIDDYKVLFYVNNIDEEQTEIEFQSLGDLNIVTNNYVFNTINMTATYLSSVIETQSQTPTFSIDQGALGLATTGTIYYNSVAKSTIKNVDDYYSTFTTPLISADIEVKELNFTFTVGAYSFSEVYNQTVYKINIQDCEDNATWTEALKFVSKDEETDADLLNLSLHMDLQVWFATENTFRNFTFDFKPNVGNHSVCIYPADASYLLNAIMEYQDMSGATTYVDRKYYLDNYSLDNTTDTIFLYNLDSTKSSNVVLKVFDKSTGANINGAYVKILRYYPELGTYKTVEIEKTDTNGQTLAKMVLYDVFYKYIVEYDREIVLNTGVEKVLTTTKLLPVSLTGDVLESLKKINNVITSVTCTNSTKTCRFTWSDTQNLVQKAVFEVWRTNGYGRNRIHYAETEAVAGTMVYVITEDTDGNNYLARGRIHTNTEFSWYNMPFAELLFGETIKNWGGLSFLFPIMLLMVSVSFALLGVGAIGIISGSLIVLIVSALIGWLPLSITSVITFIILGGLLIIKIRQ